MSAANHVLDREQVLREVELDEERRAAQIRLEKERALPPPAPTRWVRLDVAKAEEQAFEDAAQMVRSWWAEWKQRRPHKGARPSNSMVSALVARLRSKGRGPGSDG